MAALAFPNIDPIAFSVGPFAVRWYGLAYLLGFLAAWWILTVLDERWKLGLGPDGRTTTVFAAVIGVIAGGRLGYVLFYGAGAYWRDPVRILQIWDGGMSFHGGLIGILLAGVWVAHHYKVPFLRMCDVGAVGAPVGIFLGRIANFINGELWGRVTTAPWGVVFPAAPLVNGMNLPRHPSQLYEALLEGLVTFIVMLVLVRRRRPDGFLLGWMLTLYGVFRIFVEFFRQPDVQVGTNGFFAGWLTTGMILSVPLVIVGVWLVWRTRGKVVPNGDAGGDGGPDAVASDPAGGAPRRGWRRSPRVDGSREAVIAEMERSRALVALVLVAPLLLFGCTAPKTIDALWPTATSEHSVPRPAGSPRWPLTGLDAPSPEAVTTRIVSVKIENSPAARPQSGLDKADIVYETVTEGGITRFNALFQSQVPKVVGPVRSARPSDFSIVPQYHALFAHCGADPQVRKQLADRTRFDDMDQFYNPGPYWRAKDRAAPHNLYVDIAKLRVAAVSKRGYVAAESVQGLTFLHAATDATPTVGQLTVAFSASNKVVWRYDPANHVYLRSINGKPHVDKVSHKQYSARNVVVLWTTVRRYTASHNSQLLEIQLTGSGRASVFRDGQHFDGTWEAGSDSPPVLRASDGTIIGLDAGNTWFQVIGNEQDIIMK